MGERTVVLTGGAPWGMRLAGGKDFGSPLTVSQVTPGSKASFAGVKNNDCILSINGKETREMKHMEARNHISAAKDELHLVVTQTTPKSFGVEMTGNVSATSSLIGDRPRPPPPPTNVTKTVTTPTSRPAAPPTPPSFQVQSSGVVKPSPPVTSPRKEDVDTSSLLVGETGLGSSNKQSPSYERIMMADEVPFGYPSAAFGLQKRPPPQPTPPTPPSSYEPPTHQMRNIRIQEGNVMKTSDRPSGYIPTPPPGVKPPPATVTTKSIDTSSLPHPTPPPSVPSQTSTSKMRATVDPVVTQGGAKITARQGECGKCGQLIRGPFVSALGKSWHPEHFTCTKCKKALQNQSFVVEGEDIFCEPCYEKSVAPQCEKCKAPITGAYYSAANRFWHQEHFTCSKCRKQIGPQEGFNFEQGQLYCVGCFNDNFGQMCTGCKQMISATDLWVEAQGQNYHPGCFRCEGCGTSLEGGTFFMKLGRRYCKSCHRTH